MALNLYTTIDSSRIGADVTLSFTDASGTYDVSFVSTCHIDISSVTGYSSFTSAATQLATLMNLVSGIAGTYSVSFSTTTLKYTISLSAGTFTLNQVGSGGTPTTSAFVNATGLTQLTGASVGPVTTVTSDTASYYAVIGTVGGRSDVTPIQEAEGLTYEAVANDGTVYLIGRTGSAKQMDFSVRIEPKENVYTAFATAGIPWTHEHLFQYARQGGSVVIADTTTGETVVGKLRADGSSLRPVYTVADYTQWYDVPYKLYVMGRF